MCLSVQEKFRPAKFGYKVQEKKKDGCVRSCMFGMKSMGFGKWLDENDYRTYTGIDSIVSQSGDHSYPMGWHVWHTKRAAQRWLTELLTIAPCIVRVEVAEPITTGYQEGRRVTVAKKIKVLKEV